MSDIGWLQLNEPEEPAIATPQHLKFARDLMESKEWTPMTQGMPDAWWQLFQVIKAGEDKFNGKPILRRDVNMLVTELKKCPPKRKEQTYATKHTDRPPTAPREQYATPKTPHELEDGMYRRAKDGVFFKLYHTVHGANVQVAKELIVINEGPPAEVTFEYRGRKPLYSLKPSDRLTIEQAREFGHLYGTCCICGRTLTNELSIALGIGPVCGNREFGGEFTFMVEEAKVKLNNDSL